MWISAGMGMADHQKPGKIPCNPTPTHKNVIFQQFVPRSELSVYSQKSRKPLNSVDPLKILTPELSVCVEILWPSQPNGVMSSAVSLPNHTFTGQA